MYAVFSHFDILMIKGPWSDDVYEGNTYDTEESCGCMSKQKKSLRNF